jgi:hypothetical protein
VLVLLERKDAIDDMLKEVVSVLHVMRFYPLNDLFNFSAFTSTIETSIKRIQSTARMYIAKKRLPQTLMRFHASEITKLLVLLVRHHYLYFALITK